MYNNKALVLGALFGPTLGCIWDGSFNSYTSVADFNKCGTTCGQTQVGSSGSTTASATTNAVDLGYQWYIKGSESTQSYIDLSSSYKNPVDTACKQGAKITVDKTSTYNNQGSLRTELVPVQKAKDKAARPMNKGKVAHHFSVKHTKDNAPDSSFEHQLCYFESGLVELRYGCGASEQSDCAWGKKLRWIVSGEVKWEVEIKEEEWHNCIYEIDYEQKVVSLWHSTFSGEMTKVSGPHSCGSCQSTGSDWHVGVAVHQRSTQTLQTKEDWYFSGCYVEDATHITTHPVSVL